MNIINIKKRKKFLQIKTKYYIKLFTVASFFTPFMFFAGGCNATHNENINTQSSFESSFENSFENSSEIVLNDLLANAENEATLETTAHVTDDDCSLEYIETIEYIKNTYGINILYGNDVTWKVFPVYGVTEKHLLKERVNLILECLSDYPIELFNKLSINSPINISLVASLNGADGYTDGNDKDNIQIILDCSNITPHFRLSFHHEMFHFIEYYLMYNYAATNVLFKEIENLMPQELYGTTDYSGTIYDCNADVSQKYFTSIYAKTNSMEDYAETFSFYMCMPQMEFMKVYDCPINQKMIIISDIFRSFCDELNKYEPGEIYWEKNITFIK